MCGDERGVGGWGGGGGGFIVHINLLECVSFIHFSGFN